MKPKVKVVAYITREQNGLQLLVNQHRDFPEAGVQVPAGTVEEGEEIETALLREIFEESGLESLTLQRKLTEYLYYHEEKGEYHYRHVYHLTVANCPDTFTHMIQSDGEDDGLVFNYYWLDLPTAERELVGNQGDFLHLLVEA